MPDQELDASEGNPDLSGSQRAALLLMALGEQEASEILKHMEPKEVQALGTSMASIDEVTQGQIGGVLDEFVNAVRDQSSLSIGSHEYLNNILKKALGKEKAGSILSRISMNTSTKGLETLKWMEPRAIADLVRNEHPQIISIVLVYLESDQSAKVLALLSEDLQSDIIKRIASLDGIPPSALKELDAIIERRIDGGSEMKVSNIGGIKTAADILNAIAPDIESNIVEQLDEMDADLSMKIQDQMFIFENLLDLDDRGIQSLLREVSSDSLIIALKGASPEMQEKVFKNMSKRAAEMLRDDLESKGPVRLTEVEEAQKEVLTIARKMAEEGKLMLSSGGDDFV